MFVKICGLTSREDALAAVEAGANAIGFVFAPSPRTADPDQIAPWLDEVPAGVLKVGVFVDEAPEKIEDIGKRLRLDVAQLHGSETPSEHPHGLRIWKAFRVKDSFTKVPDYPAEAILIDGPAYDWSQTSHFSKPLILAGGLNPDNVTEAIHRACHPGSNLWAVDVSSGIESAPGRKDHARMKQFIEAALRA
jgi:phosphoribosylanthranilate isomerase